MDNKNTNHSFQNQNLYITNSERIYMIREKMADYGISLMQLAKESGLSYRKTQQILFIETPEDLNKLEAAMFEILTIRHKKLTQMEDDLEKL
jgi:GTP:adenosylcobinamide-phosphate guanylyltransferase